MVQVDTSVSYVGKCVSVVGSQAICVSLVSKRAALFNAMSAWVNISNINAKNERAFAVARRDMRNSIVQRTMKVEAVTTIAE